jgi:hypothetical protein
MAKKYVKIGAVLDTGKGPFIVLGNSKSTDPKYVSTVNLQVLDGNGEVLVEGTNGAVSLFDPRRRPGISEEQAAKIPDTVVYELVIVKDE